MLQKYYRYRDWDPKTGFPSEPKLKSLGLDYVDKDLAPLRSRYLSEAEAKKKKYYV